MARLRQPPGAHILDLTMSSNRRPVLKVGVVDLGVEPASLPGGVQVDLAIIRHPGASAIVALDADMQVAMLTQYRYAIDGWLSEIPAGCRNPGEDFLQCARRELGEEASLAAVRWDHLGSIVTIPSFCDERIELYRVGLHHLAFRARSRTDVDQFHRFLAREEITILDTPSEYPQYGREYYAVFFADPDGMKLELVHFPWGYWRKAQTDGRDDRP